MHLLQYVNGKLLLQIKVSLYTCDSTWMVSYCYKSKLVYAPVTVREW